MLILPKQIFGDDELDIDNYNRNYSLISKVDNIELTYSEYYKAYVMDFYLV